MRLRPEQLQQHLSSTLAAVYLISGDEPLQMNEACDAVRRAAKQQGYTNREVMDASKGFDWYSLAAEADAFSLFADKKLIDLRIPSGKPERDGSKALLDYCERPPNDTVLLLTLPKLDKRQQGSKWFKAIEKIGVIVSIWPIDARQLPRWIEQRMRQAGLAPSADAVKLLADRVEGNLLAAHQEIEKILLLQGPGVIDAEQLQQAVADSARYDVFELVDSALQGDSARSLRIIEGLKAEGVAAPVVLWALHREIALLGNIAIDVAKGLNIEHAMKRHRVWDNRKALVQGSVRRIKTPVWLEMLSDCHEADAAIKGCLPIDPWLCLQNITAKITLGRSTATAIRQLPSLR